MRLFVAGVLVLIVLGVAGPSSGAFTWRTVTDRDAGFAIGIPATWQLVPRSTPRLTALVLRLRSEKRVALANQYAQIAAVRRATHTTFRFQAFAWPAPKGAVVPDVTVKVDPLSAGTTEAALPFLARQVAKALARAAGTKASAPVPRSLPAGHAMVIIGTTPISKTVSSRFALYLLMHGRKLYSLSFRGPVTPYERRIAVSVRFVG